MNENIKNCICVVLPGDLSHGRKRAFPIAPVMHGDGGGEKMYVADGRAITWWCIVDGVEGFSTIRSENLVKEFPQCHIPVDEVTFQRQSKVVTSLFDDAIPRIREEMRKRAAIVQQNQALQKEVPVELATTADAVKHDGKRHPMADVIHAWAEGATIISREKKTLPWRVAPEPEWDARQEYRVALPVAFMVVIIDGLPILAEVVADESDFIKVTQQVRKFGHVVHIEKSNKIWKKITAGWASTKENGTRIKTVGVKLFLDEEGNVISD